MKTRNNNNRRDSFRQSNSGRGSYERGLRDDRPWRKERRGDRHSFLLQIPAVALYAEQVEEDNGKIYKDELRETIADVLAYMKDSPNIGKRLVQKLWDDRSFGDIVDAINECRNRDISEFVDRFYSYLGSEKSYDELYDSGLSEDQTQFMMNIMLTFTKSQLEDLVNVVKDYTEVLDR